MKTITKLLFIVTTFLFVFASCGNDDDDEKTPQQELEGLWRFQKLNFIYYFDGEVLNIREDGDAEDLLSLEETANNMKPLFFEFKGDSFMIGDGQYWDAPYRYTVSDGKIKIYVYQDSYSVVKYKGNGNKIDLTFTTASLELIFGKLDDSLYMFDEVEAVCTFIKV